MGLDAQEILKKYFDIPYGDRVVGESKIQNISNKNFDNSNNLSSDLIEKIASQIELTNYILNTDPRLTDSRNPLTHTHLKADVTDLVIPQKSVQIIHWSHSSYNGNLNYFWLPWTQSAQTTENLGTFPFSYPFRVKRLFLRVTNNTKNAVSTISFRANGQDIGLQSLDAGQIGVFDLNDLNVDVAANSNICGHNDTHLSNTGVLAFFCYVTIEVTLI